MPAIDELEVLAKDWSGWPNLISRPPSFDDFQFLDNGLTNNNWLLHGDQQRYVIRMNAANAKALYLNREAEWHIHDLVSQEGLCPSFIYRHPSDKYWIRPFQSGLTLSHALTNETFDLENFIRQAAVIFRKIHSMPLSSSWPRINFKERTDHYWNQLLEHHASDEQRLIKLKEQLDNTFQVKPFSAVLCHMDANAKNWIIESDTSHEIHNISLIDWEYAAVANPMWDLAVFLDHLPLNEEQEACFLKAYGPISFKALSEAKQQMQYLSQLWFVIQQQAKPESLESLLKSERS
ncbi:phosphotransferase [Bermanella marisrubri]|uniref:Cholinephosphate cytidylyltransferase/choline kinase n=1 Tax=Bermanella marisrubri TaxID=207949 RepID=Q1N6U9_9GAMM|nr:phosphotransferase [Bermanella marisrubri]EAT13493.1 cholinephosphate cytidylyltransferase/choline kinase [Oceanobacter sp. RED65] [Bermanella marisrubri]QIZ84295.1 phosphotransferase [Bermanella marisrubri]